MKLAIIFVIVLCLACVNFCNTVSRAEAKTAAPLNFDTQLIKIFEAALKPTAIPEAGRSVGEDQKILDRILTKLRQHKMMLKNVVYRTDMGVIRVTWADDNNEDVVKAAYKTGKDPVLGNSVYADKRQVISVKIMYRTDEKTYGYMHLENVDIIANPDRSTVTSRVPAQPTFTYRTEDALPPEQCEFCHVLARNDGSDNGIFFPRYQETYKTPALSSGLLFRAEHFTRKPAEEAAKLGLPNMKEDFLYQKVMLNTAEDHDERTRFFRALMELPQLIEVMARDNKQSTCVAMSFGDDSEKLGFGRNDYVCADNKAERLSVRMTNAMLTVNHGPKEYSEPYFARY